MNDPAYFSNGKAWIDNPSFSTGKPHCNECNGAHEPSGARADCIRYWKHLAYESIQSVEHARTLLCSATPGKLLDETQQQEWAKGFGKWFANSHSLPVILDENGCAGQIIKWLGAKKYRTITHRHMGSFRATDESSREWIEEFSIPLLADGLYNWPENAKPL